MIPVIDNRSLSRASDIIFASDAGYAVELPMVGRDDERRMMEEALSECDEPRLVTIAAPLGTGKTFLLNKTLATHERRVAHFDARRNCQWVFATNESPTVREDAISDVREAALQSAAADVEQGFADVPGLRVLVVEELDRKASLEQLLWSVEIAKRWLGHGGDRLLVLTGEALGLPAIKARLTTISARRDIILRNLDIDLLRAALSARISSHLVRWAYPDLADIQSRALADEAAEGILLDEYVRWSAVPLAEPSVIANFREALGTLKQLSSVIPCEDGHGVRFPRELLTQFRSADVCAGVAGRLEVELVTTLQGRIASGGSIRALSADQLAALVDRECDDRFRRRGIEPLAIRGLVTSLGVPYSQVDEAGRPWSFVEPFMPSYGLVHRALAGLIVGA